MKIYKKKNQIIVKIPFWSKRMNPYMLDENDEPEDVGEFPTLTGLIIRNRKNGNNYDEIGFAQTIDMDYKNKQDQVGDFVIRWHGDEEEFKEKCKELGLGIMEMDL